MKSKEAITHQLNGVTVPTVTPVIGSEQPQLFPLRQRPLLNSNSIDESQQELYLDKMIQ